MTHTLHPTGPYYDQSTYLGRVQHMSELCDARTLLVSDARVREAKELLLNPPETLDVAQALEAHRITLPALHPDTLEPIVRPFRMSAFVVTNLIPTVGMLLPNMGMAGIVAWQIVNQSVNVGFNFANANKTNEMPTEKAVEAYLSAVAVSCTVAVGLNHWVKNTTRFSASVRGGLLKLVPFLAVVAAGTANMLLMRQNEIRDGIAVYDEDDHHIGDSRVAGAQAIAMTTLGRVAAAVPAMVVPPFMAAALARRLPVLAPTRPYIATLAACFALSQLVALPFALAIFPQRVAVSALSLEERFHEVRKPSGESCATLYFNKGL